MRTRKLFFVMLAVLVAASLCVTAALADGTPQIVVSSVGEATPGSTADVTVSLANNPGINTFTLQVDYDATRLKLTGITPAADFSDTISYDIGTKKVGWQAKSDTTYSDVFFTLSFEVLDDAEEGAASVSITYNEGDICNFDEEDVIFTVVPGSVTVKAAPCAHGETEIQNKKDATCTEEGYTGDKVCKLCNTTLETGTVIPKTAHTWNEGTVTTEANCTEEGEKTVTCTVCGAEETQTIPAKGHTWDEGKVTAEATCTEDGEKTVTCKVCGAVETQAIPAGHTWDEGKVTKEATASAKGEKLYTCTVCGATRTEEIPALGAAGSDGGTTKKSPQTGDESAGGLWFMLALACVTAGAVIAGKKPRRD